MSIQPESRETKPAAVPRHPILAHLTLGTFVAAGLFGLLSALPYAALPSRELYRAAAFLLILGAVALVSALGTGFRERARHTMGGSPARLLPNAHAASMIGLGAVAVLDIALHEYAYPAVTKAPRPVLLATALLCGFAGMGGRIGGRLVYRLGVGTAYGARATTTPVRRTPSARRE
jgi:uncharacterized membrane protein